MQLQFGGEGGRKWRKSTPINLEEVLCRGKRQGLCAEIKQSTWGEGKGAAEKENSYKQEREGSLYWAEELPAVVTGSEP